MEARCNPAALHAYYWELKRGRDNLFDALNALKKTYEGLDWDDHVAFLTEQILNQHIAAMNRELYRLGGMIRALEELQEEADDYTDFRATDVSVM